MAGDERIVICGAGAIGASVAYFLTRRGARPAVIERARPAAAASGRAAGFLALDWNAGTPLDELARASFGLHRELADELGAERLGYRPMDALMTAAADDEDLQRYRRLPNPGWLDGNVVAHEVIGGAATTAQVDPRRFTTAAPRGRPRARGGARDRRGGRARVRRPGRRGERRLGQRRGAAGRRRGAGPRPLDRQAQRWLALPQVFGTKSASIVLGAEVPAQAVFSEFLGRDRRRSTIEMYPRAGGVVYVAGHPEPGALPDDPDEIVPSDEACEELHRVAGVHSSALRDAEVVGRSACYRPLTVDGIPLIGPVPGAPGAFLATGHASWGILNAPATGRMVGEMILDGASHSVDASPFAVTRLPGRPRSRTPEGGSAAEPAGAEGPHVVADLLHDLLQAGEVAPAEELGEVAADAVAVDGPRVFERREPLGRRPDEHDPPVVGRALAPHQAGLLHAVDHAREAAPARQDPRRDLVHRHAAARLLELDEDVVPAERELARCLELGVEDVRQRECALEEDAPRHQLLASGA